MVEAWGHNDLTNGLEYVSKVTLGYDEGDFSDSTLYSKYIAGSF